MIPLVRNRGLFASAHGLCEAIVVRAPARSGRALADEISPG